jgi:hypothetical protein
MKNNITLTVLIAFVILMAAVVGVKKVYEKYDRKAKLRQLHPVLVFTLAFIDLTKLHVAALDNDADHTEELIEEGWAVDRRVKGGFTPLHVASMCGSEDCATVLVKHGADIDKETKQGMTPLSFAAVGAKRDMLEFLLDNGAQPGRKNRNTLTPAEEAEKWYQEFIQDESRFKSDYEEEVEACIQILKEAQKESKDQQQKVGART